MSELVLPFNKEVYNKSLREDNQRSYKIISDTIINIFEPKSVIDFGCGCGWVLYYLNENIDKKNLCGIEISEEIKEITNKNIISIIEFHNLSKIINLNKKYSLSICLEVAEHIPENFSNILLDNIIKHSIDIIMFSAATPGQGGHGHINERSKQYWINKFKYKGISFDNELTENISTYWKQNNVKSWYYNNIGIYRI